ncbi:MAG TPA: TonB-dependent receptor plug domain-containing protein [Opitutaceae bacterium]
MRNSHTLRRWLSATVFASTPLAALAQLAPTRNQPAAAEEPVVELERFVTEETLEDPNRVVPNQPTQTVVGFDRKAVDTPRAFTVISSDLLESMSIRNSEDIARIAPSTYSNFRFGLQGNVNVRNLTSDFYFRGMRRIDPQGNFRTIFAANDSIEIVRGLPSPIFGLGRIGGYLNFNPKTARLAKTGKYLEKPTGSVQLTLGSWDKRILTAEVGGPVQVAGRNGGYHVFGYLENSSSYYDLSPNDEHEVVQATLTLDVSDKWRLETGGVVQYSRGGLPGGINRTTAQFLNDGLYWNGTFAYDMDTNNDGRISDRETLASYFGGLSQNLGLSSSTGTNANIGASANYVGQINSPFYRRVPWQGGAVNGGTITIDQFRAGYTDTSPTLVGGQPTQRMGYQLMVYPLLPNGTPNTAAAKVPYFLPYAFDLDPDTFEAVPFDYQKSFGEDFYEADVFTAFVDLIDDSNPDLTIKAQFLADYHDQIKQGRNPFSQFQEVFTAEEKITVTKTWHPAWEWLEAQTLASANFFYYDGGRLTDLSVDIDFRRSLMSGFTPQDTFTAFTVDRSFDGSQMSVTEKSEHTVAGLGFLQDMTFFKRVNVMLGGRVDQVNGNSYQPDGLFLRNGNGGRSVASKVEGSDTGWSYSASTVFLLPYGLRPYVSYASNAALLVNASTGSLAQGNLRRGALAEAELQEAGLKGSLFKDALFFAFAAYEQSRTSFDPLDGDGSISATIGRGFEFEMRWVVNKRLNLIGGANWNKTNNLVAGNVSVDARFLGYPDVVDSTGQIVIPAEAFGWGGRLQTTIPEAQAGDYAEVEGFPHRVLNLTATYALTKNLQARWTVYHQGSYATDRLKTIIVPEATAHDAGLSYAWGDWFVRLNITNVFDKLYFNKGAFNWVHPRVPRSWELAVTRHF